MKKMVPHDLMRVQITKISVYIFLPAVLFLPSLTLNMETIAACVVALRGFAYFFFLGRVSSRLHLAEQSGPYIPQV